MMILWAMGWSEEGGGNSGGMTMVEVLIVVIDKKWQFIRKTNDPL